MDKVTRRMDIEVDAFFVRMFNLLCIATKMGDL
jgi:hypothetical protein